MLEGIKVIGAQDLNHLVDKLELEQNEDAQITILQDMERVILDKYIIQIDGHAISPLWVEAYYYSDKFEDDNTHRDGMQENRFGELYFHRKGRGGIDVCLSQGKYYLSFLIKAFLLDGVFKTQTGIYDLFPTKEEQARAESFPVQWIQEERKYTIIYSNRIGLTKPSFKKAFLGAFPAEIIGTYPFSFPAGYKLQWQRSLSALVRTDNTKDAKKLARVLNGSKIEERYWLAATAAWEKAKNHDLYCIPFNSQQ